MITVYSKSNCPACVNAKKWLKANNFQYVEHNLDDQEAKKQFLLEYPFVRSVPQLFVVKDTGEKIHIGGYDKIENIKNHI